MSRGACFRPDPSLNSKNTGAATKGGDGGSKKRAIPLIWIFRRSKGSPRFSLGNFFRNVGEKVSKALPTIPARKKCSGRVSSSAGVARSRSYAEKYDSQRAEAIEDCIEFLNNPSLQRSSSINGSC